MVEHIQRQFCEENIYILFIFSFSLGCGLFHGKHVMTTGDKMRTVFYLSTWPSRESDFIYNFKDIDISIANLRLEPGPSFSFRWMWTTYFPWLCEIDENSHWNAPEKTLARIAVTYVSTKALSTYKDGLCRYRDSHYKGKIVLLEYVTGISYRIVEIPILVRLRRKIETVPSFFLVAHVSGSGAKRRLVLTKGISKRYWNYLCRASRFSTFTENDIIFQVDNFQGNNSSN